MRRTGLHSRPTVLIAEDDERMSAVIADAVGEAGFDCHCVGDGVEALNYILEARPDLVVLDLILPRLQGDAICAMVRKSPRVQHTPVLIVSGHDSRQHKLNAFEVGADDYVCKPFNLAELVARVKALRSRTCVGRYRASFVTHGCE